MSMFTLLSTPECFPFAIALAIMLGMAALEGVSSLLGFGASSFLDGLVPEMDFDIDVDADAGFEVEGVAGPGVLTQTISWLRVGRVPMLVLLVVFLTSFGLIGLTLQSTLLSVTGRMLPAAVMSVPALLGALPSVRFFGGLLEKVLPKDETAAVSRGTFVGRVAHIVLGTARRGAPAQARVRDEHGRTHYVMVEPDEEGEEFNAGDPVLLVRADGSRFRIIRPSSDVLLGNETN